MYRLILRESKYSLIRTIINISIQAGILILVTVLYRLNYNVIMDATSLVFKLPVEVIAFLGFETTITDYNLVFYMSFIMMPVNLLAAYTACNMAYRSIYRDEHFGTLRYYCCQMYSRNQLCSAKYIWSLLSFLLSYLILHCILLLLVMIAGDGEIYVGQILIMCSRMFIRGFAVIAMFQSFAFLAAAIDCKKANDKQISGWLIFGTLILGNIYKVVYAIRWCLEHINQDAEYLNKYAALLKKLYWLSPMSWLNPFALMTGNILVIKYIICICLITVSVILAETVYHMKSL